MNKFRLRFNPAEIKTLSARFEYGSDSEIIKKIFPRVKKNGFINKKDFLAICEWKTPRSKPLCRKNSPALIKKITGISLATKDEKEKIEILLTLCGVGWPTASTILHFVSGFKYPVLDYRAIWSLNAKVPAKYTFDFWNDYTLYSRKIAKENKVSLRVLDKALWQYSAENQG